MRGYPGSISRAYARVLLVLVLVLRTSTSTSTSTRAGDQGFQPIDNKSTVLVEGLCFFYKIWKSRNVLNTK